MPARTRAHTHIIHTHTWPFPLKNRPHTFTHEDAHTSASSFAEGLRYGARGSRRERFLPADDEDEEPGEDEDEVDGEEEDEREDTKEDEEESNEKAAEV